MKPAVLSRAAVMTSVVLDHSMHFIVAIVCRLNSAAINM